MRRANGAFVNVLDKNNVLDKDARDNARTAASGRSYGDIVQDPAFHSTLLTEPLGPWMRLENASISRR